MPIMAEVTLFTLLVRLSGSTIHVMTNPIMLEVNKSSLFLDGCATPSECRSGLMYMSILGKPTDQDLDQCPHVLLTSPHEWYPSVLDYSHPNTCGYPSWAPDPSVRDQQYPRIDECGQHPQ